VSAAAMAPMMHGRGPLAGLPAPALWPEIHVQLLIASALFVLYSVSLMLESRNVAERRLREIANLHHLVTEHSRDAIIIADFDGNRSYVSASAGEWGGWEREELLSVKTFDLVHPDDLPRVAKTVRKLRSGDDGALVEYRLKGKSGQYVWVEGSLRTIRDPGTRLPTGFLNSLRDISERKQAEQKLKDAYHAVETLAITDGLTALANRRRFDQCLAQEWRRCMRDHLPLSLLLIDVDLFKVYNDTYGHLRGDSCLKQIAEAAQDVVARPGDLVARFGGEEFAVLLPSTANGGALHIAEEICTAMRMRQLTHAGSPFGIVTISVGCATLVPGLGQGSADLIELADGALYQAKKTGRNRVSNSAQTQTALVGEAELHA
jgi:diguanylate cyclase (GGDEF)-like protein/PAS domain S-box-containing protein